LLDKLLKNAIKYCKGNNILKYFLKIQGSWAFNMISSEWNWFDALEVVRDEVR